MMSIIVKELSKIYGSGENRVTALDRAVWKSVTGILFRLSAVGFRKEHAAALDQRSGPADFRYGAL